MICQEISQVHMKRIYLSFTFEFPIAETVKAKIEESEDKLVYPVFRYRKEIICWIFQQSTLV